MAAQEYYLASKPPQYEQPHPQAYSQPTYANTPPPSYSAHPRPSQQPHSYPPHQMYQEKPSQAQAMTAPYPQTPPAGYYPSPLPMPQQQQQGGYFGAPLQPVRSHSQPAHVRFADQDSDRSTSLGSISDTDDYFPPPPPPRHHHSYNNISSAPRQHRTGHSNRPRHHHERTYSSSDYPSDRDRYDRHNKPRKSASYDKSGIHGDSHKNRDTFLGAGAGTIIGDAIFPGLGTAAGLVLGGYGGRKYARERSKSEDVYGGGGGKRSHGGSRRAGDDGWDEKTRTYRKGAAVR